MKKPKPFSQKIDKNIIEFQILPDKVKQDKIHNDSILSGISLSGDNFDQNMGQNLGKDVKGLYHLSQESDNIETLAQQEGFRSAVVQELEKPPLMTSKRSSSLSNSSRKDSKRCSAPWSGPFAAGAVTNSISGKESKRNDSKDGAKPSKRKRQTPNQMRGSGPSTPHKELAAKPAHKQTTATRLHTAPAQPEDNLASLLLPDPQLSTATPPQQLSLDKNKAPHHHQPSVPKQHPATPNTRLSPGLSFTQKMRMKKANGGSPSLQSYLVPNSLHNFMVQTQKKRGN